LPGDFSSNGRREVSYWLPNQTKIQTLMAQYFEHTTESTNLDEEEFRSESTLPDPMKIRIAIQDGSDNPEAVQALVRYLDKLGYKRVLVASNWREPLKSTRIVAQNGDALGAADVRANLGFGEILVESTGYLVSDVTIQLGKDWQKTAMFRE
jgi:polyisoprenyl-teichoic acid--peptidoglycan teichoic acid transferase